MSAYAVGLGCAAVRKRSYVEAWIRLFKCLNESEAQHCEVRLMRVIYRPAFGFGAENLRDKFEVLLRHSRSSRLFGGFSVKPLLTGTGRKDPLDRYGAANQSLTTHASWHGAYG